MIHFKRFRQHQLKGPQAAKLTTMVKFPMNGFDMSPHLAKTDVGGGSSGSGSITSSDSKYDLYAVCYHQGNTLETGHYTAACLNPYDQEWYRFDDQRVSHVAKERVEEDIINDEAYMLFYQRRKSDNGSDCSTSNSSSNGEHWTSRIPPDILPKEKGKAKEADRVKKDVENRNKEPTIESVKPPEPTLTVEEKKDPDVTINTDIESTDLTLAVNQEPADVKSDDLPQEKIVEVPLANGDMDDIELIEEAEAAQEICDDEVDSPAKEVASVSETEPSVEDIEQAPIEENCDESKDIQDEEVVVRKSSPIPIQRFSAPLNLSKAFAENQNSTTRHSSYTHSTLIKESDIDAAVSLLRSNSSCSKDTFLFMDHRRHLPHHHRSSASRTLIDEDDVLGATNQALWVSGNEDT